MRRLTLALALAAAMAAGQATAQNAAADIRAVISEQIEAFKADDFARAFTYASPNIKRMFGDSARFGRMVREGYPMVWRPSEVRFSGLSEEGGRMIQSVLVKDAGGALFIVADQWRPGAPDGRGGGMTPFAGRTVTGSPVRADLARKDGV